MRFSLFLLVSILIFLSSLQSAASVRPSKADKFQEPVAADASAAKINPQKEIPVDPVSLEKNSDAPLDTANKAIKFYPLTDSVANSSRKVRVLLHKNIISRNFFVYGKIKILSDSVKVTISQGSIRFLQINENRAEISAHGRFAQVNLPCTLSFISGTNVFSDGNVEYRGDIIFSSDKNGFSVINFIDVEDYLRGVVPPEIGIRAETEFESLKAQAVAARTYTLSKVLRGADKEFDLLPTIADQVYGGVNCEYALSDLAVEETRGIVMLKNDATLLETYYHSSCGGITASIDEVWNSAPNGSLVSRRDFRPNGAPYCGNSKSYSWKETWTISQFSQILKKYSVLSNEAHFEGTVKSVSVVSKSASGRVIDLAVVSEKGTFHYGKDKVRFVLRRPKDESILRSAIFNIKIENAHVVATGCGYGHGIGMCQTGAIERSKAGQNYIEILNSYYSRVKFSSWDEVVKSISAF